MIEYKIEEISGKRKQKCITIITDNRDFLNNFNTYINGQIKMDRQLNKTKSRTRRLKNYCDKECYQRNNCDIKGSDYCLIKVLVAELFEREVNR